MKKQLFIFVCMLCFIGQCEMYAQYYLPQNKVWAMGFSCGLKFAGTEPIVIPSNMTAIELVEPLYNSSSVADENGNMLFYTDGMRAWTANGVLMPHGYKFLGPTYSTSRSTQGSLIVPDPNNHKRYYLFSISSNVEERNLFCNVVDMRLNNGQGDIDTTFYLHGVILRENMTNKLIAAKGCNNSTWILTKHKQTAVYEAYSLTSEGLNQTPVISVTGSITNNYGNGSMTINPAGTKLIACSYFQDGLELCDFNPATGVISNAIVVSSNTHLSAAFSPDGSKLYVHEFCSVSGSTGYAYQYDLNAPNIAASKTLLFPAPCQLRGMKLAPDGKIYFLRADTSNTLGRINFPNLAGLACGYQAAVSQLNFYQLSPFSKISMALPNEVVVPELQDRVDTVVCTFSGTMLLTAPAGANSYLWDDGSDSTTRTITQRGIYWVKCFVANCNFIRTDTFKIKGADLPDLVLTYNGNTLSTTNTFDTYKWYHGSSIIPGATSPTLAVNTTGIGYYSVVAGNVWGCTDSAWFKVDHVTAIDDPASVANQIYIYPNPAVQFIKVKSPFMLHLRFMNVEGQILTENKHTKELNIADVAAGLYLLQIRDEKGHLIKTEKIIKTNTK